MDGGSSIEQQIDQRRRDPLVHHHIDAGRQLLKVRIRNVEAEVKRPFWKGDGRDKGETPPVGSRAPEGYGSQFWRANDGLNGSGFGCTVTTPIGQGSWVGSNDVEKHVSCITTTTSEAAS